MRTGAPLVAHRPLVYGNSFVNSSTRCSLQVGTLRLNSRHPGLHQLSPSLPRLPPAFVFDIDGVLVRGAKVISGARRALDILEGNNPMRIKIPYLLMTNGGGSSEEERCKKLSRQLGHEIKPSQLIQAHTILKQIVHKYSESPILVLGGRNDVVRKVAEGYGFQQAFTTLDVLAWNPSVWPFHELTSEEHANTKEVDFSRTPISAIFVFHDPRNWALDTQIICDVIQSGGIIGDSCISPQKRASNHVELVFCNPDLLWRSDFDRPRLGQGAFKDAFQAVFKSLTGSTYPYVQFGKPTEATYTFASRVMADHVEEMYGSRTVPSIYMIGDNPESDIAGANAAGWSSILVRTGVYDPDHGAPAHSPTYEVDNVEQAVRLALEKELNVHI